MEKEMIIDGQGADAYIIVAKTEEMKTYFF